MTSARPGWLFVLVLSLIPLPLSGAEDPTPGCRLPPHTPTTPRKELVGAWETVFPAEGSAAIRQILGMQTVHNVILPSGKVLMVSGSSWRNKDLKLTDYWPYNPAPVAPTGAFNRADDPFLNSKIEDYYRIVNNAAVYDPADNTFYRIPHPVPVPDPNARITSRPMISSALVTNIFPTATCSLPVVRSTTHPSGRGTTRRGSSTGGKNWPFPGAMSTGERFPATPRTPGSSPASWSVAGGTRASCRCSMAGWRSSADS